MDDRKYTTERTGLGIREHEERVECREKAIAGVDNNTSPLENRGCGEPKK